MRVTLEFVCKGTALIISCGLLWGCSQFSPSGPQLIQPLVSDVAVGFNNYHRVTKTVAYVNPYLAMLCRGASKKEVEEARMEFGPHANTGILVYMNESAATAFTSNASTFPVGAVIVKQKRFLGYTDNDGKEVREADTGVGGMVKRPAGYDSMHGDWEYFYFADDKKIESGRIASCVRCHASAKDKDYVFGRWRNPRGFEGLRP